MEEIESLNQNQYKIFLIVKAGSPEDVFRRFF